jgi:LmbE family N-acetylglucosaminyl deacetylase
VAHPDDEIIWFDPLHFDLIIIVFCERNDRMEVGRNRLQAIQAHPLRDRIRMLNISESGFWKDKTRITELADAAQQLTQELCKIKKEFMISEIYTHNSSGEYGHDDHVLVHECVVNIFKNYKKCKIYCPVKYMKPEDIDRYSAITKKIDINFYNEVLNIYLANNCWTWSSSYVPCEYEKYYQIGGV